MNLAMTDPRIEAAAQPCRVVVETPKGSRCKYSWDPSIEALELSGLLPAGMSFPLDFGMVPGTVAKVAILSTSWSSATNPLWHAAW